MTMPWRTPTNATPRAQATASANSVLRTPIQAAQLGDVEQADRRRDDDRREDRLGHRLDEAGHEEEHQQDEAGRDEAGQLGLGARLGGDGRPRAARAHREPREEPGGEVGRADPGELLVAVDLVAAAPWRSRPRSRSCRRWRRARCRARRRTAAGCRTAARAGSDGTGKPCGSTPITRHAARREVEHDRQRDRDDDGDEDAGRPRRRPA